MISGSLSAFVLLAMSLAASACVGCDHSDPPVLTREGLKVECDDFCTRKAECFKEVCRADYPDSIRTTVSEFAVSVLAQNCYDDWCATDKYMNAKKANDPYLTCTAAASCREMTTGKCGETAVCTTDPNSTPFLPGSTTVKAPSPAHPAN